MTAHPQAVSPPPHHLRPLPFSQVEFGPRLLGSGAQAVQVTVLNTSKVPVVLEASLEAGEEEKEEDEEEEGGELAFSLSDSSVVVYGGR